MDNYKIVKISKFMSLVLRHKPELINLNLDKNGWARTEDLLKVLNRKYNININDLNYIVENNNKKRFSFSKDKSKIRAVQGHSINVDLLLKESKPPLYLYHGTSYKNAQSILNTGINKSGRHHVHLSEDISTALNVGKRKGEIISILRIRSLEMFENDIKFYLSENNVWLTDFVDKKYIEEYI